MSALCWLCLTVVEALRFAPACASAAAAALHATVLGVRRALDPGAPNFKLAVLVRLAVVAPVRMYQGPAQYGHQSLLAGIVCKACTVLQVGTERGRGRSLGGAGGSGPQCVQRAWASAAQVHVRV